MCLVLGLIFGVFANYSALELSWKALQCIVGIGLAPVKPMSCESCVKFMIGIVSLSDCESATYSASVVDRVT